MEKNNKKLIIIELVCFFIQIIFSNICIKNIIYPFGLPFAFVRTFFGGNVFFIIFSYLISQINFFVSFSNIFICFFEIVILTLFYFSLNLKIIKKPLFCLELAVLGSMTLKLYYLLSNNSNLLMFAFELILKIIVIIFFYKFFIVFKNKFLFFKFSNIDYLYFSLICLFLSVGIYSFQLEKIYLEYFMLSTIIMLSCKILPPDKFFVFVLSIAIGADIAVGCDSFILFSSIMSILIINVKNRHKILFAATSVISILLYVLLLEKFDSISIYISFVAIIIFLFIPTRKFEKFSKLFELDSLNLMFESLRREKSLILKNKLSLMSNTLQQMKNNLKFLIVVLILKMIKHI